MNSVSKKLLSLVLLASLASHCTTMYPKGLFSNLLTNFTSFFKKPKNVAITLGAACICALVCKFWIFKGADSKKPDDSKVEIGSQQAEKPRTYRKEFLVVCFKGDLQEARQMVRQVDPFSFLSSLQAFKFISKNICTLDLNVIKFLDEIYSFEKRKLKDLLIQACQKNKEELIAWLVADKKIVLKRCYISRRILGQRCPLESIKCLEKNGHSLDNNLILIAVLDYDNGGDYSVDLLKWAIEKKGVDKNQCFNPRPYAREKGPSLLQNACLKGNVPVVKYLLSIGADTAVVDSQGDTPLQAVQSMLCHHIYKNSLKLKEIEALLLAKQA